MGLEEAPAVGEEEDDGDDAPGGVVHLVHAHARGEAGRLAVVDDFSDAPWVHLRERAGGGERV